MKKFLASAIVAVSVLSAGTSAFAAGDAYETDSFASPNIFQHSGDSFEGTITNNDSDDAPAFDYDYYKWTNDTGATKLFYVNLKTYQNMSLDYRIRSLATSGAGSYSNLYSETTGLKVYQVILPPGGTVAISVQSANLYQFDPNVKYIISLSNVPWF